MSESEERIWHYLNTHRTAPLDEVALDTGTSIAEVEACIARIASPNWREPTGILKRDAGKARYDLIPPEIEEAMALVLTDGAEKYADRDWERGTNYGRYYAAMRRHQVAWWRGENLDPETGRSHLWHAACCLAFLVTYEARNIGTDDRPRKEER